MQEETHQVEKFEQQARQQWLSEYIAKMLNLKPEEREQTEGSIYLEYGLLQSMLSIDNTAVPNINSSKKNLFFVCRKVLYLYLF